MVGQMSDVLTVGHEIEKIRCERGIPVFIMYGIFDTNEVGYHNIVYGRVRPTVFQLIMFIDSTHCPLQSIIGKKF